MEGNTESRSWKEDSSEGVLICTYAITDPEFPYSIDKIRLRYSYKQDTVALLDIDNKKICMNVSVGYIRVRDKMSHEEYGEMVFRQIENILAGKPVETVKAEEAKKETVVLDLTDSPIREGNYILFTYASSNIQAFKINTISLSLFCKRCNTLNVKSIGEGGSDIKKNTKTRFDCVKCTVQLSVDSAFHLVIPSGGNTNNLMRLEYTGVYNVSIREVSLNCLCSECSASQVLQLDKKTPCSCGCILEMRKDKAKPLQEIISQSSVPLAKMPLRGDVNALLKTGGTCEHYKKSSRIFIFPCCNGRYACDICHNKHESHAAVRASRMICGKCGVESPVSPVCGSSVCKAALTGKASSFWEGGKGSRNKITMSRKDSKKYSK
ncbi:hypothetical protein NEMIN01_0869 [Nematocida minor]|uniref:uncharacterized protein n=1 Tax=Nematocida minor TaxID=1912983 RepID=UPI002220366A|nr:uncharacterized protein NEMIN01_0869 [Nematocida minor]KAI5190084.1 hypothetical protein NEMIN01_0869 [Nematocida minor]